MVATIRAVAVEGLRNGKTWNIFWGWANMVSGSNRLCERDMSHGWFHSLWPRLLIGWSRYQLVLEDCGWGKFNEKGVQFCFFIRRSVLDTYELKCSFDNQVEMTNRRSKAWIWSLWERLGWWCEFWRHWHLGGKTLGWITSWQVSVGWETWSKPKVTALLRGKGDGVETGKGDSERATGE